MQTPSSGPNPVCSKAEAVQLLEDLRQQYQATSDFFNRRHQLAIRNELLRCQHMGERKAE